MREVEPHREAVSFSEENTFDVDVDDREILERTILAHAEAVARRLRRKALMARTVVLKWRLGRRRRAGPRGYPARTRQATLAIATDDGGEIARVAISLLDDALAEPVRLLGVGVSGLVGVPAPLAVTGPVGADLEGPAQTGLADSKSASLAGAMQIGLFEGLASPAADGTARTSAASRLSPASAAAADRPRRRRLNQAIDALADRFGDDVVRRASQAEVRHATMSGQWKKGSRESDGPGE